MDPKLTASESEHFKDHELRCPHCKVNGMTQDGLDMLEQFRAAVGKPVIINSAYRCQELNAAVGGAKASQHMIGNAADVRVSGMTPAELETIARGCSKIMGIGRADHHGYLHIDCRKTPQIVSWCYSETGQQCAYYLPKA